MAAEVTWEVSLIIQDILISCFIYLTNLQELAAIFHCIGFPNCMKAMDSTHIPILCPPKGTQTVINFKGYFSIVLQGNTDHQSCFIHIFAS